MALNIYKTKTIATAAMKRQGLDGMNYDINHHCSAAGTGYAIVVYVHDADDADDIRSRGFFATINPEKAAG